MSAAITQVADAVVESLNGTSFSQWFLSERVYVPVIDLTTITSLTVSVVPRGVDIEPVTRDSDWFDVAVDIGIQARVDPADKAAVDAMTDLVEEVIDHLRHKDLAAMPAAAWLSIANNPVYMPDHLKEFRTFTSVITVTYRIRR